MHLFVIPTGFEPVTYCLEGSCSIQLSYEIVEPAHVIQRMDHPAFIGAYRRTRTANPLITSQVLYQLKLCRHLADFSTESCLSICRALEASSRMFRNLFLDYLMFAVVSTVLVESPAVRQVLSAQVLSHTVESEALVSVLLLQAAKDKVATAIKEKINFFIRLLLTVFFK